MNPGTLSALIPLVAAIGAFLPRSLPQPGANAPAVSAVVTPRQVDDYRSSVKAEDSSTRESSSFPSVITVRNLMDLVLPRVTGGAQGLALIRATLSTAFPGLVTESQPGSYYVWVWCEDIGEYVQVCCSPNTFRIALEDPVVVEFEVITPFD